MAPPLLRRKPLAGTGSCCTAERELRAPPTAVNGGPAAPAAEAVGGNKQLLPAGSGSSSATEAAIGLAFARVRPVATLRMAFDSFRDLVQHLDRAGELIRISQPVATELEITELADREMKSPGGGKALLIEKPTVNGQVSPFPLAINTMGSWKRMAMSLGAEAWTKSPPNSAR